MNAKAIPLPLVLAVCFGFSGCQTLFGVGSDVYSPSYLERPSWTPGRIDSAEGVLEYLTSYPEEFSLVAYWTDAPERGVYHNADTPRPLASTMKVLVLAEYARQVEAGLLDPAERVPLDSVGVYYVPLTDGGAHRQALAVHRTEGGTVALDEVARMMIRFSSNTATDYLIARLGRDAVLRSPVQAGAPDSDPPLPISGLFGGANARGVPVSPDEAFRRAARFRSSPGYRRGQRFWQVLTPIRLSYFEQRRNSHALPAGTAEDYADLMARAYTGTFVSDSVSAYVRDVLRWPMLFGWSQDRFEAYGLKSGSVAGVLTRAMYARPQTNARGPAGGREPGSGIVVALFVQGLPRHVWETWYSGMPFADFTTRMMLDPEFFEHVRAQIALVSPPQVPR
ncbi:serine hydrolase [Rubrivirga sp.]|uniref:serine hydrolase n=1 Tax=Rubrivirga sp. TaxID=1885344 RepID=UPI003C7911E2